MPVRAASTLLAVAASLLISSHLAAQAPAVPAPPPPTVELDQTVVNVQTTMPLKR